VGRHGSHQRQRHRYVRFRHGRWHLPLRRSHHRRGVPGAIAANTGLSHALVVSSNIAGPGFVGPATKSDGTNIAGVPTPIPEGYRIQLDPSIDVDAIPGITPAERVIAKTLQTYGAYVVDQGDATLAFVFQMEPDATSTSNPGAVWTSAGLTWDYYDMADIPWTQLRVIAP
jgi:hypothetical protein